MALRDRSHPRRYVLGERFAAGGMGELYHVVASDEPGPALCVKRMVPAGDDQEMASLFLREVAVAALLEHPNVVEVIDAGNAEGQLFMVMSYVDGPSLAEVLLLLAERACRLSVPLALAIVSQAIQGLRHAHERSRPDSSALGIVHRDVAPQNILMGRDGTVRLVDFGLAKLSGQSFTAPGVVRGRPRSLAPEQARGDAVDARTDVFGMGAVLFELLAGAPLYAAAPMQTLLYQVATAAYGDLNARLSDTEPGLKAIVRRALAPAIGDRYASARAMGTAIDEYRALHQLGVERRALVELVESLGNAWLARRHAELSGPAELSGRTVVLPAETRGPSSVPALRSSSAGLALSKRLRPLTETDPARAEALARTRTLDPKPHVASRPRTGAARRIWQRLCRLFGASSLVWLCWDRLA